MQRDWLKAQRLEKSLSQAYVAEKAEITQSAYFYIENGERRPSVETAKKIAAVLGFDWTLFYPDNNQKEA